MLLLILILKRDTTNDKFTNHQRVAKREDYQDVDFREFDSLPKKSYVKQVKMEVETNNADDSTKRELQEAKARIEQLEKKIAFLEGRIPQKYPEVKYLGYKERKRILVSN